MHRVLSCYKCKFVSGSYKYFLHLGWCCYMHKVQYRAVLLSCSYSSASCNLFCRFLRFSGFPILHWRIEHTWSTDLNPSCRLEMNFSADLTFASLSSPSLLKTIDHTSNKKPSMPTSSNGCGGKNVVVPQPVRAWKGRRAVDCLDIKILFLFRGPWNHQQVRARDTRWMCNQK